MKNKIITGSLVLATILLTTSCKVKKTAQDRTQNKQINTITTKPADKTETSKPTSTQDKSDKIASLGTIIISSKDSVSKKNPLIPTFTSPTWKGCPSGDSECFKKNMFTHIKKHFVYPEEAKKQGLQGKVYVFFEYDETGVLDKSTVKVLRGTGHKILDEAAKNLILTLPNLEKPGLQNGKPMRSKQNIPISYKLM